MQVANSPVAHIACLKSSLVKGAEVQTERKGLRFFFTLDFSLSLQNRMAAVFYEPSLSWDLLSESYSDSDEESEEVLSLHHFYVVVSVLMLL